MKTCTKCLRELSLDHFSKARATRDGLNYNCRDCTSTACKSWREKGATQAAAYIKAWRKANPEKVAAQHRRYRKANAEKIAAQSKVYCLANLEKIAARSKAYYEANPEDARRRRAQQAGVFVETIPNDIKAQLIALYGPICMVPGCENRNLEIDHIVPLSKGGDHVVGNFQLLCKSCNSSKGNRHATDYRRAS